MSLLKIKILRSYIFIDNKDHNMLYYLMGKNV